MNGNKAYTKHIFVLNPSAGQKKTHLLLEDIQAIWETAEVDYEIYETTAPGDGESYVRSCCEEFAARIDCDAWSLGTGGGAETASGDKAGAGHIGIDAGCETASGDRAGAGHRTPGAARLRIYACGGDGTLSEVVNGSYGFDFAEVGCIPMGSGNDFVRNFPGSDFSDLLAQFRGESVSCDLIRYDTVFHDRAGAAGFGERAGGESVSGGSAGAAKRAGFGERAGGESDVSTRYCVNMFNIGFDCNVVDTTDRLKRLPLLGGSLAYLGSVAVNLIEKKGADLMVIYPDGFIHEGKLLLLSVANGCFCGGGIKGLPLAKTNDGLMDVSLVKNVSRHTFVSLFPKYQVGSHLDDPRVTPILRYSQEPTLTVFPIEDTLKLCVDGEIYETGPVNFKVVPGAFRFVIPKS